MEASAPTLDGNPTPAPYGSWASPISAAAKAAGSIPLAEVRLDGDDVYWLERRAQEGGRSVIVRQGVDGERADVTPAGFNVRTRVHEYGGGAYMVRDGTVYFSNFADQRLYRQDRGSEPRPITPEPEIPSGDRYADACLSPDGRLLLCVRERHQAQGEAVNEIVVLPTDGSAAPRVVVGGHDFCSFPRVSPDGQQLAWTTWDHPSMPWDGTDLWLADLAQDGSTSNTRHVAGATDESVYVGSSRVDLQACKLEYSIVSPK